MAEHLVDEESDSSEGGIEPVSDGRTVCKCSAKGNIGLYMNTKDYFQTSNSQRVFDL